MVLLVLGLSVVFLVILQFKLDAAVIQAIGAEAAFKRRTSGMFSAITSARRKAVRRIMFTFWHTILTWKYSTSKDVLVSTAISAVMIPTATVLNHKHEIYFRDINLEGVNLANSNLKSTNLKGVNLKGANLKSTNLEGANLEGANLEGANLSGARLVCTNLRHSVLNDSLLENADLSGTDLENADLRGSDLTGVQLWKANLRNANLTGAKLFDANFRGTNLEKINLDAFKLADIALSSDADLLKANWTHLTIDNTTYHREAVERGETVLPFGMGNPLRFIFGINRELTDEDLSAIRKMIHEIENAARVSFRITGDKVVLPLEGRERATEAGRAASMLLLLPQIRDQLEQLKTTFQELHEEDQEAHGQQLIMAAKEASNNRELLELVKFLYLKEIELRDIKEVEEFKKLIDDTRLQEYFGVSGTTIKILKSSATVLPVIEPVLKFLGLGVVVTALKTLKSGSDAVKSRKTKE